MVLLTINVRLGHDICQPGIGGFEIVHNDEDVVHPFKRHMVSVNGIVRVFRSVVWCGSR